MSAFQREISLIGEENFEKLQGARVAVFGIGGVGSYAAEALVRAGVGSLDFIDGDVVAESNLNRQLIALTSTLGRNKAEVMAARASDISPSCRAAAIPVFYNEQTAPRFDFSVYDYVADCIDSVSDKVRLILAARAAGVPVLSCMGAGNRIVSDFRVDVIEKTSGCPLARIVRRELKKAGVTGVKAVYSPSEPLVPSRAQAEKGERWIGSISFVPSAAGLLLAGEIVRDLCSLAPSAEK